MGILKKTLLVVGMLLWIATSANAGTLSGPILDLGATAVLADYETIPSSSGSRPFARINVTREAPDGSGRLFTNDLNGPFYVIDAGVITTYMDLSISRPDFRPSPGLATGFVSIALHPEFGANGLLYTVHTEDVGSTAANLGPAISTTISQHVVLTEWTATVPSANTFSGTSRELMRIESPHFFHNVGEIAFNPNAAALDPDYGLLYICAGDYGSVQIGEPEQLQRLDTPYGTLMRIDPLGGPFTRNTITYDYGIPTSNPFANDPDPNVLGEIYAYGFRNGHRIEWDQGSTPDGPYVSDVGQGAIEEINLLVAGQNYGWPEREGNYALDPDVDPETVFALPGNDATFGYRYPVAEYDHDEGSAIAGGIVYRGTAAPNFAGQMIFGDIQTGRLLHTDTTDMQTADDGDPNTMAQVYELGLIYAGQPTTLKDVVADALGIGSIDRVDLRFASDNTGQIYLTTKQDAMIRTLTPVPEPSLVLMLASGSGLLAVLANRRRNTASGRRESLDK